MCVATAAATLTHVILNNMHAVSKGNGAQTRE